MKQVSLLTILITFVVFVNGMNMKTLSPSQHSNLKDPSSFVDHFPSSEKWAQQRKSPKTNLWETIKSEQKSSNISEEWWKPDTIISYSLTYAMTTRDLCLYDAHGNKLSVLTEYLIDGVWTNIYRVTCAYDERNNLTVKLEENWNAELNQWTFYLQSTYEYDMNNNLLSELLEIVDYETQERVPWDLFSFTYDESENLIYYSYKLFENQEWKLYYQYTITYNEHNLATYSLYEELDYETGVLSEREKKSYTYDEQNRPEMILVERWDIDYAMWVKSKTEMSYNAKELLETETHQFWDEYSGVWMNEQKSTYSYNDHNDLIHVLWQQGAVGSDQWINMMQTIYEYEGVGQYLSLRQEEYWDGEIEQWVKMQKVFYEYDSEGNPLSETLEMWNLELSDWEPLIKGVFEYDIHGNAILGKGYMWNVETSTWEECDMDLNMTYYGNQVITVYSAYKAEISYINESNVTALKEINPLSEIVIAPNPVSDNIIVRSETQRIEKIYLYNLTGKLLQESHSPGMNVSNLPSGVYLLKVKTDKGAFSHKIIKI